jgi:cofilin
VKAKMMYASTKDYFKSHLDGLSLEFQASDLDEISEEVRSERVAGEDWQGGGSRGQGG